MSKKGEQAKKGITVELGDKDLFAQPRIVPYQKHLGSIHICRQMFLGHF